MSEAAARRKNRWNTLDLVLIALFSILIAICSWISIPTLVPFTLQTFGVFCAVGLLGGKRGTLAVALYVLLGLVGLPVFAGFSGGPGVLLGSTGGYILGFLFSALIYWLMTALLGNRLWVQVAATVLGLLACYAFGTAWFVAVYARNVGAVALGTALSWCVIPFILPDLLKIALATVILRTVPKHVQALR